jgi:hypothetical protein
MRIPRIISRLIVVLIPMFCCSCSMMLVNTVPTSIDGLAREGMRGDLDVQLGQPLYSDASAIPNTVKRFPNPKPPSVCDVYQMNGLAQMQGDPYFGGWTMYPAYVILTAGAIEVFMFPYVSVDLAVKSFKRYELRVWYDQSDRIVAYERRKQTDED